MKICWFNQNRLGVVIGNVVHDVTEALQALPAASYPAAWGDLLIAHLDEIRTHIAGLLPTADTLPIEQAHFKSPVQQPSKIIGVPVNYLNHVREAEADISTFTDRYRGSVQEQGLFLKANSALVGASQGVHLGFSDRSTHHEMELGVVIGKTARNITSDQALSHIAGYAIALDMVVRGPEDRSLRKSLDTYAVLGPWLVTADEIDDPQTLDIELSVNGQLRQQANTSQMIVSIAEQIAWASSFYTLWPGDIIMTGTCEGVGPVVAGDVMSCSISNIGDMRVRVSAS